MRRILLAERPDDAFLGEETGELGQGWRLWILDGIDGTAVFVQGDDRWQTVSWTWPYRWAGRSGTTPRCP